MEGMEGSSRWEYWAPSVLLCPDSILSHTPCCVITRGGALTSGRMDQTDSLEFYGNFSSS